MTQEQIKEIEAIAVAAINIASEINAAAIKLPYLALRLGDIMREVADTPAGTSAGTSTESQKE
jgi:hypothetical protein